MWVPGSRALPIALAAALAVATAPPALAERNPERNVYFGEQHVHSSWSFDALAFGDTRTGPEEFYQYATGRPTLHGEPTDLREMAELMHGGEAQYQIRDGRLVTELGGAAFEVTVYRLGDAYHAARSDEFGYANYQVEPGREPGKGGLP